MSLPFPIKLSAETVVAHGDARPEPDAPSEYEAVQREMLTRDPLPPIDSDLEYAEAANCQRDKTMVLFNGKPALGVVRANAREGWVECISETVF